MNDVHILLVGDVAGTRQMMRELYGLKGTDVEPKGECMISIEVLDRTMSVYLHHELRDDIEHINNEIYRIVDGFIYFCDAASETALEATKRTFERIKRTKKVAKLHSVAVLQYCQSGTSTLGSELSDLEDFYGYIYQKVEANVSKEDLYSAASCLGQRLISLVANPTAIGEGLSAEKDSNVLHITLLGDLFVGKSMVLQYCTGGAFSPIYVTTVEKKEVETILRIGDVKIQATLIDTPGLQRVDDISDEELRQNQGYILVCSAISQRSFDMVKMLYDRIAMLYNNLDILPIAIIITKGDSALFGTASTANAVCFAKMKGLPYALATPSEMGEVKKQVEILLERYLLLNKSAATLLTFAGRNLEKKGMAQRKAGTKWKEAYISVSANMVHYADSIDLPIKGTMGLVVGTRVVEDIEKIGRVLHVIGPKSRFSLHTSDGNEMEEWKMAFEANVAIDGVTDDLFVESMVELLVEVLVEDLNIDTSTSHVQSLLAARPPDLDSVRQISQSSPNLHPSSSPPVSLAQRKKEGFFNKRKGSISKFKNSLVQKKKQ